MNLKGGFLHNIFIDFMELNRGEILDDFSSTEFVEKMYFAHKSIYYLRLKNIHLTYISYLRMYCVICS